MAGKWWAAAFAVGAVVGWGSPAAAGPISVVAYMGPAGGVPGGSDEIRVSGLGAWAVLTTGGGVNYTVTVAADQTTARQAVVGYWPVMAFLDRTQYEAQRGTVVTVRRRTCRSTSKSITATPTGWVRKFK